MNNPNAAPLTASDAAARHAGTLLNSDAVVNDNPFKDQETKFAYRVKRSGDTDTVTLLPFCELWNGSDRIARLAPGRPEHKGFMDVIQKSLYKPWGAFANGEADDLHPALRVTFQRRLGESVVCAVRQASFKDDLERNSDRIKRALWTCTCLASVRHVTDWTDIAREFITGAVVMDLPGAQAAIIARSKTEDGAVVVPNIEEATKLSKEYEATMEAQRTSELDKVFPRDANGKPVDEAPKHWSADGAWRMAVADERKKYRLSAAMTSDEFSDWLHKIFDVKSLKELSMTPQAALGIICDTLKSEFGSVAANAPTTPASASNAVTPATDVPQTTQDATAGKSEPQTVHATAYPNYPESPVIVYPMDRGGIVYKGIRFSVTMRLGGTWAMALTLMDDFASHREFIDPSCVVHSAPMQTAATGGSTAPRDEDAPPMDDDEPGEPQDVAEKREKGTAIARSVEGNKTTYTIWFNVGSGAETRFPLKISNPQGVKLLETSLRAAKHNPDKWENGKRYNSVHVNAAWVQGAEFAPGKHYKDWTRFEVVREVEEVPA